MAHRMQKTSQTATEAEREEAIMTVQCCVCKRVREGKAWYVTNLPERALGPVSHGYCPVCAARAYEELRAEAQRIKMTPPAA